MKQGLNKGLYTWVPRDAPHFVARPVRPVEANPLTSNNLFTLLGTAPFGAYAVSLDQTIVFWNRSAQRILGYSPDTVVGQRCYDTLSGLAEGSLTPECARGCPGIRSLRAGLVPTAARLRMLCASGERKLVSLTPMVIVDVNAAPLLMHLFDDRADEGESSRAADAVRAALSGSDVVIVSDQPVMAPDLTNAQQLTRRELEVLRMMSQGWRSPQIASDLGLSLHTVRNHIRHIRRKLGATTQMQAVLAAMRLGILRRG